MAHGLSPTLKQRKTDGSKTGNGIGSRRIFAPQFKLQVLDSYRNDKDCKGNQRATARKYGIHRRQIQKWLQAEANLRNSVLKVSNGGDGCPEARKCAAALRCGAPRQRDDVCRAERPREEMAAPVLCAAADAEVDKRVPDILQPAQQLCDWDGNVSSPDSLPSAPYDSPPPLPLPLDFTLHSRYDRIPSPTPQVFDPSPMDLTVKKRLAYPPPDPQIWDLSLKAFKPPVEDVSSTTPPAKPVKLFKPYLDVIDEPKPCDHFGFSPYDPFRGDTRPYFPNGGLHFVSTFQPYEDPMYRGPYEIGVIKQRQSYSLDFKLSAIECYHSDAVCRGNQRAVASKFKIHRRQIQKWLKQEDQLRRRNIVR